MASVCKRERNSSKQFVDHELVEQIHREGEWHSEDCQERGALFVCRAAGRHDAYLVPVAFGTLAYCADSAVAVVIFYSIMLKSEDWSHHGKNHTVNMPECAVIVSNIRR